MSAAAAAANPGSPHLEPGDIESPPDSPPRDDGEEEPGPLNGTMNGALALTGGVPDWEATGDVGWHSDQSRAESRPVPASSNAHA